MNEGQIKVPELESKLVVHSSNIRPTMDFSVYLESPSQLRWIIGFVSQSVCMFLCSHVNDAMFKCLEPASVKRLA